MVPLKIKINFLGSGESVQGFSLLVRSL